MRGLGVCLRLSVVVLSLSAAACSMGGEQTTSAASPAGGGRGGGRGGGGGALPITVGQAVQKPVPLTVQVIGSVEPSSTVAIRAQVTGILNDVAFKEGDDVKEGQVLFALDQRPLVAALKQAEATLGRDTAQAANAQAQAKRTSELAARGIATKDQLDTAVSGAAALEATLAADRAAVDNARVQLEFATMTAPISGRTGALMVHPGNLVRANDTTALVVINQIAPVNVIFSLPEAQLPMLKRYMAAGGVHVEAGAPSDERGPSEGHITFVDNAVDPTTGTIKVKGSFPNVDHRLWPGQFVNVIMTLATDPNAIVVPTVAVQAGQQGSYIFVVKADNTVDIRQVEVGRSVGDDTIITKGIAAGETVVTDGQLRLVAGSTVSVKKSAQEVGQ